MKTKPRTVEEYLAALGSDKRAALERLRDIIQSVVPEAEPCISYAIPAFRLRGKVLIWYGAGANHCALYGVTEPSPGAFKDYDASGRGTLRFKADEPLPAELVRTLVKARMT